MPKKPMSKNMARLNEDMRRVLIDIIAQMKDPRLKDGLLTLTRVEASSDLSVVKVYVSVLNAKKGAAQVLAALTAAKGHVRSEIAARMHIRKAPEPLFLEDGGAAYAEHINKMLKDL